MADRLCFAVGPLTLTALIGGAGFVPGLRAAPAPDKIEFALVKAVMPVIVSAVAADLFAGSHLF